MRISLDGALQQGADHTSRLCVASAGVSVEERAWGELEYHTHARTHLQARVHTCARARTHARTHAGGEGISVAAASCAFASED